MQNARLGTYYKR